MLIGYSSLGLYIRGEVHPNGAIPMSTNYYKVPRKRLFVDAKVQGALIVRVVFYWLYCLLTIALMILCWRIVTGPARLFYTHFSDMWFFYGPAVIASFVLLPLVIIDIVRLSNRFVGPMLRMRNSMHALARGEEVEPLEFRENDFWHDFANEFNALRQRVMQLSVEAESQSENDDLLGVGI
jgi:hypothetical protein